MLAANDPRLKSWVDVPPGSDFPIQNLPFGIFQAIGRKPSAGVAIGEFVLDLHFIHQQGWLKTLNLPEQIFAQEVLNDFLSLGRMTGTAVRNRISELLRSDNEEWNEETRRTALIALREVEMKMPIRIPNYTDFYSSEQHAINVGKLFRNAEQPLLPNWKHLPVGYHGRASSIVVSGTPVHRPKGQIKLPDADAPVFEPSRKLDFELEIAFVTSTPTRLGEVVNAAAAEEHIFGVVLFNDWSARDMQQWEYAPLGPFLGKSFGSVISPWIVTLDALESFRVAGPVQEPSVLPYLQTTGAANLDVELEVLLITAGGSPHCLSHSNARYLYWNMKQQLAHQTSNGCNLEVGDLYASGTISGPAPDSFGSLLELSGNGAHPIRVGDSLRTFLEDGDTIVLKGYAQRNGVRIGWGQCSSQILPST